MGAPLVLVSSMATRSILAETLTACRAATGIAVELHAMGGVDAAAYVRDGRPADLVLLAAGAIDRLAAEGIVDSGTVTPVARSAIAVAIPAGTHRPDLSGVEAVKAAMLAARAVCYSTGPSGDHLKALWQAWGIAEAMAARAIQAPPGVPVARIIAEGQADFGIQQVSELIGQPGIDIITPLPDAVQLVTVFTGAMAAAAQDKARASAVLAFLASQASAGIIRRHGMEPA